MATRSPLDNSRPRRRRRTRALAWSLTTGFLVVASVLTGIYAIRGTAESPSRATPVADVVPAYGGTYTEGSVGIPASLNPLLATMQSERDLAKVLFQGLVSVDGSGLPQPGLARSWEVSEDGLRYTFMLRDDALWHDGTPVTAQDVVFTVKLVQDPEFPGDPALSRFWRGILVDESDEHTVTFALLEPFSAFPNYASLPIVPRHLLGGVLARDLASDPFSQQPVGTGLFRLSDVSLDAPSVTLEPFADYYGAQPYIERVVFKYYDSTADALDALNAGEVDGTGSLPLGQILTPGAVRDDATVYAPVMSGFTAMFLNLRNSLFANADVRQAIEMAVDRKAIVEQVAESHAALGRRPIPETSWSYAPSSNLAPDRTGAAELLAGAGWTDSDGDGVLDNGTSRLSFPLLVNGDDPQRTALAEEMSRQLAQVGIQVVVHPVASSEVNAALSSRQFSAAIFGWHTATGDPDCYQLWHSSQTEDGLNFTGLRNTEIDEVLEQARRTANVDDRKALYEQFQQLFEQQSPAVILFYPRYHYVMSSAIHGVEADPLIEPSDRLLSLGSWFVAIEDEQTEGSPSP